MEYKLIKCDESQNIELLINVAIEAGYIPQGGIAVRQGSERGAILMQAMVKKGD